MPDPSVEPMLSICYFDISLSAFDSALSTSPFNILFNVQFGVELGESSVLYAVVRAVFDDDTIITC